MNYPSLCVKAVKKTTMLSVFAIALVLHASISYASTAEPPAIDRLATRTENFSFFQRDNAQRDSLHMQFPLYLQLRENYQVNVSADANNKAIYNEKNASTESLVVNDASDNEDADMEADYGENGTVYANISARTNPVLKSETALLRGEPSDQSFAEIEWSKILIEIEWDKHSAHGKPGNLPTNFPSRFFMLSGITGPLIRRGDDEWLKAKDYASSVGHQVMRCTCQDKTLQREETNNECDRSLLYRNGPRPRAPSYAR